LFRFLALYSKLLAYVKTKKSPSFSMDGQFQMHLRFCKQKHGVTKRRKKKSAYQPAPRRTIHNQRKHGSIPDVDYFNPVSRVNRSGLIVMERTTAKRELFKEKQINPTTL